VVLGASAGSALMVAMPGASRATALLHKVDISTDAGLLEEFAQQEYAKQSIPFCIKYGPSVRLLAVALVAAAQERLSGKHPHTFSCGVLQFIMACCHWIANIITAACWMMSLPPCGRKHTEMWMSSPEV